MKNKEVVQLLWHQFGASLDMLHDNIVACPEELWDSDSKYWYITYHTLFFLDYYLSEDPSTFHPPAPFTLSEFDPSGLMPDKVYSQDQLVNYLSLLRKKAKSQILGLTKELMEKRFIDDYRNYSRLELTIYNMRHVQHHVAQLSLLLRQGIDKVPRWVSRTKD